MSLNFGVTDTGPGIPEEGQQKIFERFRQLDGPDGKFHAGTGLGLAICQSLSELMGGRIGLNSKLGVGTSFFIRVPFEPSEVLEGGPPAEWRQPDLGAGCTILVAEDEPANRTFLQAMLRRHEFEVLTVENGAEAVERIESGLRPNIILMDIKMPVMDGYEATSKVKQIAPEIPVIAQTAYVMADDMQSAMSSDFDDYVSKPISAEDLVSKALHLVRVEVSSDRVTQLNV